MQAAHENTTSPSEYHIHTKILLNHNHNHDHVRASRSDETVARTVADMISNFEMKMSCVKFEITEAQDMVMASPGMVLGVVMTNGEEAR